MDSAGVELNRLLYAQQAFVAERNFLYLVFSSSFTYIREKSES
jgi:hypothetical protein